MPSSPRRFAPLVARPRWDGAQTASFLAHLAPPLGQPLRGGSEKSAVTAMRSVPPVGMDRRGVGAGPERFRLGLPSGPGTARAAIGAPDPGRSRHLSYVLVAQDFDVTARDR